MAFATTESKREEYRKYLEKTGVIDQLTRVLVELYEETNKPESPIDYMKKHLGSPSDVDIDSLKIQHTKLKEENELLKQRLMQGRRNAVERAAVSRAVAGRVDLSAVQLHEASRKRQPDTEAA